MIYFVTLFNVVGLLLLSKIIKQKNITYVAFVVLVLFSGLRYGVGRDFNSYWDIYKYVDATGVEWGYRVLCSVCGMLAFGPQIIFLLSISISLFFVYKSIVYYSPNNVVYPFFVYIFAGFYLESFNIVRQSIAISIFLYSSRYIINKSFYRYLCCIILASFFHYSSLFLLPFYFVLNKFYSNRTILISASLILVSTCVFPLSNLLEMVPLYGSRYLLDNPQFAGSANLGVGFFSKIMIALALLFGRKMIERKNVKYRVAINSFFLYIFFAALFHDILVFLRISYYFHIFLIFLLPVIPDIFKPNIRLFIHLLVIVYSILLCSMEILNPHNMLIPYNYNFNLFLL